MIFFLMKGGPPRSSLFPKPDALPISAAQVRAHRTGPDRAAVAVGDLAPDRLAVGVAPAGEVEQCTPRVVDRLLGPSRGGLQGAGDLLVVETGQLTHDERSALTLGQLAYVVEDRA